MHKWKVLSHFELHSSKNTGNKAREFSERKWMTTNSERKGSEKIVEAMQKDTSRCQVNWAQRILTINYSTASS